MEEMARHRLEQLSARLDEINATAGKLANLPLTGPDDFRRARVLAGEIGDQVHAARQSIRNILRRLASTDTLPSDRRPAPPEEPAEGTAG